ncbi:phosphate-selective porin O and P [Candidatus Nitrosoglobus terrae]|uniref:Phosphate-selective porin O and P n=1 Tax=Candidatus Nitrosoglobus terrae TaxID=1630141 RepID=A0A1Q2SLG4_9GAMM|nr:porin [Candidatus Nitrosoglobus terrae]BAW79986.1 phosphate-selective porin O and P [Candidatus Nitrosoglobus terrae]
MGSNVKKILVSIILSHGSLLNSSAYANTEILNQEKPKDLTHNAQVKTENKVTEQNHKESTKQKSITVKADYTGLTIKSASGNYTFNLGGRIQGDSALLDSSKIDLELRRARINFIGTLYKNWMYRVEGAFGGYNPRITNAYFRFRGFDPINLTLGYQKVPFSLESVTSNNWTVFQERAMVNTLINNAGISNNHPSENFISNFVDNFLNNDEIGRRSLGLSMDTYGKGWPDWTVAAGFYSEGIVNPGAFSNGNWEAVSRATIAPIAEATRVFHLGGSIDYRNFNDNSGLVLSTRPESQLAPSLIGTGVIPDVKQNLLLGGEISTVWGPFHAQSEYIHSEIARKKGIPNLNFDGWYAQTGYFLTGESRNYQASTGRYSRITPRRMVGKGGWGAWEIAARYSVLDLENKNILGGVEKNITLGINWWATQNFMIRANYVHAMVDSDTSRAQLGGENKNTNIFMTRLQLVF